MILIFLPNAFLFLFLLRVFEEKGVSLLDFSYFLLYNMELYKFSLSFFDGCFENNRCSQKEGISLE